MTNLYLIDGNSFLYRAYHAMKGLSNSKGMPTNAIYIFTNMLFKLIREKKPDALAIAFDTPAPTERHIIYDDYKAQRPKMPDDLSIQIPHIKEIINAFKITIFEIAGYEADDIICTIAKKTSSKGIKVFIISGDKDMMQVINENIFIYDPMKDSFIDETQVMNRFGVSPSKIPEIMALAGDTIDNIPGVKGIGEKTAKEILKKAGSLDVLIDNPSIIKNERLRKLIEDNLETIKLSRILSTINYNVPLDFDIESMRLKEADWDKLLSLFTNFEFNSLIKLIPAKGHTPRGRYYSIKDKEELIKFLRLDL